MYADDTQLYLPFVHAEYQSAVVQMQNCLCEMRRWMENNHLKLNDSKTEYMVIGSKFLVNKIDSPLTIQIGEETVTASASVRNIGAHLNSNMDMSAHIKSVCHSCYCHLRNLSRMRPFLSDEAAATIVHAFISSKLDFMNSLLYKVPECHLRRLQLIQNTAARIVTRTKRIQHIMPVLQQLHWLPIKFRIDFKLCLLAFKALNRLAPQYISDLVTVHVPARALRSAGQFLLAERRIKLERAGARAFVSGAAKLWNGLPAELRACDNLETFKSMLKTFLFSNAFMG